MLSASPSVVDDFQENMIKEEVRRLKNTFIFPDLDCLLDFPGVSCDKVVIISIIGKSRYVCAKKKVKPIGRVLSNFDLPEKCAIQGYYDEENQIVYLHALTCLDTDVIMQSLSELTVNEEKFHKIYNEIKSQFARYLLYLFHISHIVVLSHPGFTLDTSYIQYFKAVDSLSQKQFDKIIDCLKTHDDLSAEWIANGRFCTPRLIFYFERCPRNINNVKKLEHNLEDKIYHVLKKTRLISTTGGALFAIPLNDEFVYISEDLGSDPLESMVLGLLMDCQPGGGAIQVDVPFSTQPISEKNFKKFLRVHIDQARNKGFDDTVSSGRHQHSVPTHFELPVLKQWIEVAKDLYSLVVNEELVMSLCTETRFSEQRCLKVLPIALATYQEGLPSHYGKAEHKARMMMALTLFKAQARGPAFKQYVQQLGNECIDHWKNGRQQCEEPSLTGNPCQLPSHSDDQEHISGVVYKAVCDCGRKVGAREDPYDIKRANFLFYQRIAKDCQCSNLERIEFAFASDTSSSETESVSDSESNEKSNKPECLLEMLTLEAPPRSLPKYSSWSLVCLGASSLYSHNLGLSESHHPGFLSSTNYLLPWDVAVYSKVKQGYPFNTYGTRNRRGRPTGTQFTVKVFIGVEYECTSGHRFMLAAPDKMLKATPGSMVKDTGHKIAESDMPLYYPCACRAGKLAQLMRLHVVTPKAPVYCTLEPKVQPSPDAPIFVPTQRGAIELTQSAYWVMRLPYVYTAEKKHFVQNPEARLLKGVFGVRGIEQ